MEKEPKPVKEKEEIEMAEVELVPDLSEEMALAEALPGMNITSPPPKEEPCIVSDDAILGLYDEILANCREDRKQVGELLGTFVDMVVNDGEASSSTKEAVVNLAKAKTDINDKMAKVADLMTRIKLKDKDTFPRYLAAHQHNNVTIEANSSKREVLKALQKKQKGGK